MKAFIQLAALVPAAAMAGPLWGGLVWMVLIWIIEELAEAMKD